MKRSKIFNCALACTLILSLVLSMFVVSSVVINATADDTNIWDGTKASDFAGGRGTEDDPFLIENGAQLYKMVAEYSNAATASGSVNTATYFKLTKDIYLNDVTAEDLKNPTVTEWTEKFNVWYTLGGTANGFCGDFNGNGYTIYGLFANGGFAGLIPILADGGNIHNVNLKNSFIYSAQSGGSSGGIVGYVYSYWKLSPVTVSNCSVDNIVVNGSSSRVGGIVGGFYDLKVTVTNCSVTNASLKSDYESYPDYVSGLVGYGGSNTLVSVVTNCYTDSSVHPVNATTNKTNFDIIDDKITYTNVYTSATKNFDADEGVTYLTEAQMKGKAAKENMSGFDFKWTWDINENAYPTLKSDTVEVWDGTKSSTFAGGSGTADDPYKIENASQLAYVVSTDLTDGLCFKLVKDIRINDTTSANWKENARNWVWADVRFTGTFDGNGHTIDGLYYSGAQKRMGLFSYVGADNNGTYKTTVKNFTMTNAYINNTVTSDANGTAFVAGQASRVAYFEGIYIDETCEITTSTVTGVGGILGQSGYNVFMTNCAVHGTLNGKANIGAFVGTLSSGAKLTLKNSFSSANANVQGVTDRNLGTASAAIYATKKQGTVDSVVTQLIADQMKGEAAKANMTGLSFRFVWETVENGYPIINLRGELWDGTWVSSHDDFKGSGTKDDPYLIENGAQLFFATIKNSNLTDGSYYKLVKDIILNDTLVDGWEASAKPWGMNSAKRFNGTLDGDGHTIEGLYINVNSTTGRYGLFSYVGQDTTVSDKVCEIKNITIKSASVTNTTTSSFEGVGIVAGQASGETLFENIYIDESSKVNAPNVKGVAGIVARSNQKVTINKCAVHGTYTGGSHVSSFLGTFWGGSQYINNSYSAANVPVTTSRTPTIVNVYATVKTDENYYDSAVILLTEEQMKGEAAVTNMTGLHFGRHWKVVENGYPVPVIYVAPEGIWDGTVATSFDGFKGSGTEEDPYQIENGYQLAYVVSTDLTDGLYYKLVKDIKLNDTSDAQWTKSATNWVWANVRFVGNFDGDGHTIDGLYFNGAQGRFGLFSFIGNSDIYNFKMTNAYIYNTTDSSNNDNNQGAAIIAGQTSEAANFDRIYIDESCYLNAPNAKGVGGFVGRGAYNVNITNSAVLATISGSSHVGSFFGTHWGGAQTVNGCFSASNAPIMSSRSLSNSANNYATVLDGTYDTSVSTLTEEQMKGEAAATNMSGLDFYCTWETVENGYPVLRKDSLEAWGGAPADTSAIEYAGGNGTKASPYKIENGDQLYKMVAENSNQDVSTAAETKTYFEIIANINLGNNQWYNVGKTSYPSSANYATGFSGVIYGKGHTIYNFSNTASVGVAGLIPVATQGAEIYDLHLKAGSVKKIVWNDYTNGGLIGLAVATANSKPIVISGCSVEEYTVGSRDGSAAFVGDTYSQSLIIKDCYALNNDISHTSTTATMNSGAFVGIVDGNGEGNSILIENSFCDTSANIGYVKPMSTTFNNVYTTLDTYDNSVSGLTKITAAEITGNTAKENLLGFNFNQVWQTADGAYPVHISIEERAELWNGTVADGFAGGKGTAEEPYLISNASELYLLASSDRKTTLGNYYKLTNDISISNVYDNWSNDNPYSWTKKTAYLDGYTYGDSFAGVLDGAGYTVSGLFISDEITNGGSYAYGLIPFVTADAVIKNINIDGVYASVTGDAYVGAVAGAAHLDEADIANPLKMAQFVGAKVNNCNITANNKGDILGGGSKNAKIELCGADDSYTDDVIIYNSLNIDETALVNISRRILGTANTYITDINAVEDFDIRDLVCAYEGIQTNANIDTESYNLVWSQEFNGNELDYSVWSQNTTMSKKSNLIYADNSTVANDTLTLQCKDTGEDDADGYNIYSVNYGLSTLDTMSFKYGRLEMRAKIPFGAGAFPSLWLTSRNAIGNAAINPYDAEIDIFEVFGKTDSQNKMVTCIHKWYNDETGARTGDECSCGTGNGDGNAYKIEEIDRSYEVLGSTKEDWHTIVFEWTEDVMTFSVDGKVYYTADKSDMDNASALFGTITGFDLSGYNTDNEGLFNQFMYLRLNNHMYTPGGSNYAYGGLANEIDVSKLNYEIDYIRLYQKNDGKSQINLK